MKQLCALVVDVFDNYWYVTSDSIEGITIEAEKLKFAYSIGKIHHITQKE